MHPRLRIAFAVAALVFFFLPVGLRVVGVTARPFENRPMATFPKPSQGWDAFGQATRFFVDRLPLREQAVRANTWVFTTIYDTTPRYGSAAPGAAEAAPFAAGAAEPDPAAAAPAQAATPTETAVRGRAGWLYLGGELTRACLEYVPWPEAIRRWERFARIIRRSGRRVVLLIAPDKMTIYPEFLPSDHAVQDCAPAYKKQAWRLLERTREPGLVGLRRALLAEKAERRSRLLYLRKDSHWNSTGATVLVREALERVGGRVRVRSADVHDLGMASYEGDLTRLIGRPEQDETPQQEVVRDVQAMTETTEPLPGGHPQRLLRRRDAGAPLIAGRTLFVHDSYGVAALDLLSPYARELAVTMWYDTPPDELIEAVRRADTAVFELVEREMNYKASDEALLSEAFLDKLAAALPPAR